MKIEVEKVDGEWPVLVQVAVATALQLMSDPVRRWYQLTHAQQKEWREVVTDVLDAIAMATQAEEQPIE